MQDVKWSADLSVGVEAIDNQHKQLFAIVGELQSAITKGRGQKQMHLILEKLIAYAETHFTAEEAFLEEIGYPELEIHTHEHAQLVLKVRRFQQRLRQERITTPVLQFLNYWLKNHIMSSDLEYARYARGRPAADAAEPSTSPAVSST
jgi:hemerythrin